MQPADFGPIYAETVMGRFPVEPWNTYSNVLFLILILYLIWRTRLRYSRYPLVVLGLPILAVGFVGGTVFHATRSDNLWLRMDYLPIFILSLLAAFYFWKELLHGLVPAAITVLVLFILVRVPWSYESLPIAFKIGFGYSGIALILIAPAFLLSRREKWRGVEKLAAAITCFAVAIFCRFIDRGLGAELLPMGTHFLWHIFGATSVYFMFEFLLQRYDAMQEKS